MYKLFNPQHPACVDTTPVRMKREHPALLKERRWEEGLLNKPWDTGKNTASISSPRDLEEVMLE